EAERLWRESITRSEAYLEQNPASHDERSGLCWSCVDLCDSILLQRDDGHSEAESILQKGLKHAAIIFQQEPRSGQAREVSAFLHLHLGRCCIRSRPNAAAGLFDQATGEIHGLCADFPWYQGHWTSAGYIQDTSIASLLATGRESEA